MQKKHERILLALLLLLLLSLLLLFSKVYTSYKYSLETFNKIHYCYFYYLIKFIVIFINNLFLA